MCVPCLTIHSLTVSACWHTLRAACLNCSTWETTILADSSLCCSKHTGACYSGAAAVTRLAAVTGEQQANTCEASPFSFNCFGRWQRLQYSGCQLIKCWLSTSTWQKWCNKVSNLMCPLIQGWIKGSLHAFSTRQFQKFHLWWTFLEHIKGFSFWNRCVYWTLKWRLMVFFCVALIVRKVPLILFKMSDRRF